MEKNKNIILIGGGGHSLNCAQIFLENNCKIYGYIDLCHKSKLNELYGFKFLGNDEKIEKYISEKNYLFFISIGGLKNNLLRSKLFEYIKNIGGEFCNCLSKDAYIAKNSKIGKNVTIFPKAVVNSYAEINNNVIINSGAIVEHEVILEDNVHIAPNATILGNVRVGKNSFVGSSSVVKQGTIIEENKFINANVFYDK